MTWVAWRQQRLQLLAGMGVLAVLLALLLPSGFRIWSTFRSTGLAQCLSLHARCGFIQDSFAGAYQSTAILAVLFLALPALVGVFWGAPLVAREVEQGTQRLAWTQSVTRTRWALTKIAVLFLATAAGASVLAWVFSWWSRPLVAASDTRFNVGIFDLRGVVPIAYAVFALAIGIAMGSVLRRVVPAMGATILAYVALRVPVELWLRPRFAAPKTIAYMFFGDYPRSGRGDWILTTKTVDAAGHVLSNGQGIDVGSLAVRCPSLPSRPVVDPGAFQACVRRLGIHLVSTYQPGSRFWAFQGIESAIFVALAAALVAGGVWVVRRRIA